MKRVWFWSKIDLLAFSLVAVLFAPLLWWISDRTPPIQLLSYSATPPEVKPGETIFRVIKVKRLRTCETEPHTILIDGGKIRWYFEDRAMPVPGPLGIEEYKRAVVIPLQATPGPALLRNVTEYVCNPLHLIWPIRLETPELKFTISKPE